MIEIAHDSKRCDYGCERPGQAHGVGPRSGGRPVSGRQRYGTTCADSGSQRRAQLCECGIGGHVQLPWGLAIDGSGNLFVTNSSAPGLFEVSRSSGVLNFGNVSVGASSPVLNATLVSSGNLASGLTLGTPLYSATGDTTDLTVKAAGTCAAAQVLVPTASCTLEAGFSPSANGVVSQALTINVQSMAPLSLTLTGSGVAAAPPVAVSEPATVSYNTAAAITLSATGTGTLTYTVLTQPSHGTLSAVTSNQVTYTPNGNYVGTDSFTFQATDTNSQSSNTATVSVTVLPAPPVAATQSVNITYNKATAITLGATGNGTLTYSVVAQPVHGSLSGTAPNLIYTPGLGYVGADSLTFKATDSDSQTSNTATVTINVLPAAPVAAAQSVTASYNTAIPITLSATGTGTLTYSVAVQPTHGTLSGAAPSLTYTPASGYAGADSFTFTATDANDQSSNIATVGITVMAQAQAPIATSQTVTVTYNNTAAITLSATGTGTLTYAVVAQPAHGSLSGTAPNLTYTPTSGYSGADTFTFKATDSNSQASNTATVTINVLPATPVATAQSVTATYNTPTAITLGATGTGTLTYAVVTQPVHGTLTGTAPSLTYTPNSSYSGSDSFTFKATDSNSQASNTATVTISVLPAVPVATGQSVTATYNTATAITLSATGTGTLTYSVVAQPAHGTLTGTAPSLTYAPNSGYIGVDTFTFKATDSNSQASNTATVAINVLPAAPVAAAQSVTVSYNTAMPITLNATGTGTLAYAVVALPTNGTLTGTAPNLTYVPNSGYSGSDAFTFKATDGSQQVSNTATVTISVLPGAPVATGQSVTATYNTGTGITLSATGTGTLTYAVVSLPASGTLTGTAPSLTYTPNSGYAGFDSFTFKVSDGTGQASNTATVAITVLPAIPVGSPQTPAMVMSLHKTVYGSLTKGVSRVSANARGDVFFEDPGNQEIVEVAAGTTTEIPLLTGVKVGSSGTAPDGVTVDSAGNVYIADAYDGRVVRIPFVNGTYATNVSLPTLKTANTLCTTGMQVPLRVFGIDLGRGGLLHAGGRCGHRWRRRPVLCGHQRQRLGRRHGESHRRADGGRDGEHCRNQPSAGDFGTDRKRRGRQSLLRRGAGFIYLVAAFDVSLLHSCRFGGSDANPDLLDTEESDRGDV